MFPLVLVSNLSLKRFNIVQAKAIMNRYVNCSESKKSRSIHFSLHETTPKEAIEDRILSVTLVPLFQPKRTQNKN